MIGDAAAPASFEGQLCVVLRPGRPEEIVQLRVRANVSEQLQREKLRRREAHVRPGHLLNLADRLEVRFGHGSTVTAGAQREFRAARYVISCWSSFMRP